MVIIETARDQTSELPCSDSINAIDLISNRRRSTHKRIIRKF